MLSALVEGKGLDGIPEISKENILSLRGGELRAGRLKCALVSVKAMKSGV